MGARLRGRACLYGRASQRDARRDPRRRSVAPVAQPVRLQPLSRYPDRPRPDRRRRQAQPAGVLRAFADRTGTAEPALHVYVSDPPVELDENLPIIQALGAAQAAVTGEKAAAIIRRPGADAVHLTAYGVPCVAFGPGGRMHPDARGGSMHAVGEHVLIDDCVIAARIYLAMALDLCSRKAA